uniref:Uncharacterized protein n=2 Tax=Schistocephalus solidus TaxID=70667 RepID=A0A0X3Q374_SCHSO
MTSFDSIHTNSHPNCENLPRIKPARRTLAGPVRHLIKRLSGVPADISPPKISKLEPSEAILSKRPSFSKWRRRRSVVRERLSPLDTLTKTSLQGADTTAAIDATPTNEHLRAPNPTDFTVFHVPSEPSGHTAATENASSKKMSRQSLQITFRNKIRRNAVRASILPTRVLKTAPVRPAMMETCQENANSLAGARSREDKVTSISSKFVDRSGKRRFSIFL